MSQRVERIVVKPGHTHYLACHRLCSAARKLGNQAVYIQRQRIFAKEPWLNRVQLDQTVRSECTESYRNMPSAASAQRQTQIIQEQFVSWNKGSSSKALSNFAPRELLSITQAKFLCKRLFRVLLKSFLRPRKLICLIRASSRRCRDCRVTAKSIELSSLGVMAIRLSMAILLSPTRTTLVFLGCQSALVKISLSTPK